MKKKQETNVIIFVLLILTFDSCTYHCPAFDENILKWLPYQIGDTLKYSNKSDTLKFIVNNNHKDGRISSKSVIPLMDVRCTSTAFFRTTIQNELCISEYCIEQKYLSIRFNEKDSLAINTTCLDTYNPEHNVQIYNTNRKPNLKYFDNYQIENKTISNIFEISIDTTLYSDRIWKIILAKGFGVVQFQERNGNIWTKIIK